MNRLIRRKFGDQQALEKHLREKADKDKNGNLSVDEFRDFIIETCQEDIVNRDVQKEDVEGFLSAFTFNNHGGTAIEQVAPAIFEKDFKKLALVMSQKMRGNPPPAQINHSYDAIEAKVLDSQPESEADSRRLRDLLR